MPTFPSYGCHCSRDRQSCHIFLGLIFTSGLFVSQTSQKDKNDRISFTLTFHPHNHAVKTISLNNFKLLQNDPETGRIFSQPPLISFKRGKDVGNFLVAHSKLTSNPALSNARAHDAKLVLSLLTPPKYRDLSDLLRSPIVSHVPPQMSFIA